MEHLCDGPRFHHSACYCSIGAYIHGQTISDQIQLCFTCEMNLCWMAQATHAPLLPGFQSSGAEIRTQNRGWGYDCSVRGVKKLVTAVLLNDERRRIGASEI